MVRHLDAKVDGLSSRLKEAEHDLSDDSPILRKDRLSDFAAVKVESRSQEVAAKVSAAVSACGPCGVRRPALITDSRSQGACSTRYLGGAAAGIAFSSTVKSLFLSSRV